MPVAATGVGLLWSVLSLIASVLNSVGFYSPYWLRGTSFNRTQVTFGSFRRCVYPRLGEDGDWVMVYECGRYTTFSDIPSVSWQIVTVAVGVGSAISLLAAFTALASCCISDVLTKSTARILGMIQLLADLRGITLSTISTTKTFFTNWLLQLLFSFRPITFLYLQCL
ncbi:LHFPL tetraspan subfamily member 6 protein-like isoform X2 [Centruroides sculpturatus]|uniref:LHFPL tetraspan subfamily member 6 protein-like isoform X2 n=1 Tax=Centruroides sculpturatus TaxID=218467 RepID=UPI000C6E03C0|nr:LHFPL tetraspan subfamily member 6 protein-like isoform X2 [Centruroides sculpturatus]